MTPVAPVTVAPDERIDEVAPASPSLRLLPPPEPAPSPSRTLWLPVRLLWTFSTSTLLGATVAVMLAVGLPQVVHGRVFTVMSGSMEPTLHVGDVVIDQQISPVEARIGDIVTFRDPHGGGRLITHRVREIKMSLGSVDFVTRGDANNNVERWSVRMDGHIGRVRYRIWKLGYALVYMHTFWGRILILFLPLAGAAVFALRRIWQA